jgi:GNAT superfamily N-acetyltransferase
LAGAGRWRLAELDSARDGPAVTALMLECGDYARLVEGEEPSDRHGREFFSAVAPGKSPTDMLKLGLQDPGGELIGVADVARAYPDEGSWFIGLLLLRPHARGQGAGRAAVDHISALAAASGAVRMVLNVVEDNEGALAFWGRLGFQPIRRTPAHRFGTKTHVVVEFSREIEAWPGEK